MTKTLRIGSTDVPRIGLGTNRLTNTPKNIAFIQAAVAAGIGMIDTAHLYTGGDSEQTIGAALSTQRDSLVIATKGGYGGAGRGRPEVLDAEIAQSFESLRTDIIDLYYLHRVDPETPLEESLAAIKEYVDRGKVRHVGISDVTVEQIERARKVLPITAVQNAYNLAERKHDAVVDYCTREDIIFVAYYPLHGEVSRAQKEIAQRRNATPSQIALAWLLRRSPIMLPIPGTLSLEHLKENLAALHIELNDAEVQALNASATS